MGTVRAERAGTLRHEEVRAFIAALYEGELHTKRVTALAGATLGVMASASLAVAVIGQALAQARSLVTKHAIKQVGPPAEQCGHRRLGQLRPLGAASDRCAAEHPGGDGLDGLRPRRTGNPGAEPGHRPRAGHTAVVAQRLEG